MVKNKYIYTRMNTYVRTVSMRLRERNLLIKFRLKRDFPTVILQWATFTILT